MHYCVHNQGPFTKKKKIRNLVVTKLRSIIIVPNNTELDKSINDFANNHKIIKFTTSITNCQV